MVGDLIDKGLCLLGIHWVKSWEYLGNLVCDQEGGCQCCGSKRYRVHHNWGEEWGGVYQNYGEGYSWSKFWTKEKEPGFWQGSQGRKFCSRCRKDGGRAMRS